MRIDDKIRQERQDDMVVRPCGDYGGGGHHHFYESIKSGLESFRLRRGADGDFAAAAAAAADLLLNDDTSSIASKKRIDSMFNKATASVAGDRKRTTDGVADRRTKSLAAADDDDDHYRDDNYFDYGYDCNNNNNNSNNNNNNNNNNNKNTVQEKIDKMFAEISSSELDTDVSTSMESTIGSNKYHVQYIGCADLSAKISSLEGLQQPVRDMYFGYRESGRCRGATDERERRPDLSGLLEISAAGLTIRYRDETAGGDTVHKTSPFPSIAVWAALKYVCRRRCPPPSHRMQSTADHTDGTPYEYAFLPLISDPDGSDKAALFRDIDAGHRARLDAAGDHAPVFAVVTRKAGKKLECHGFACETENDALLMAANLYGALVAAMSSATAAVTADTLATDIDGTGDADDGTAAGRHHRRDAAETASSPHRRVIRQRNGFASLSSTAGSSVGDSDAVPPALPPPRPPRRNKMTSSSAASSTAGDDRPSSVTAMTNKDVCSDAKTFRMTVRQSPSLQRGVCNSGGGSIVVDTRSSLDDEPRVVVKQHSDIGGSGCGDIFTKVAIPRSRSFLNSNGLASTKYSRRAAGFGIETAADRLRRRSNSSSVMGFSDMFNELRMQEGLNSMDDILNVIINKDGMSYNDLKPIYREFLMKLSLTLTKDELYHRTKAIMAEQKRKRNGRRPVTSASCAAMARGRRRLSDKLRDALNLRAARSKISAVVLPDFCKRKKRTTPTTSRCVQQQRRCLCASQCDERSPSSGIRPAAARKIQRRAAAPALKNRRRTTAVSSSPVCSTSDESDFFAAAALQRQRQLQLQQQQLLHHRKPKTRGGKSGAVHATAATSEGGCPHRASSGYFSCSECSVDTCYCDGGGGGGGDDAEPASLVSCSCDSDSCADSDKCYCGRPRRPRNIFDELKSRGFAASESSVSRADSPGTAWKKNELLLLQHDDDDVVGRHGRSLSAAAAIGADIEPSKSLEYLQVAKRRPVDHYSSVAKPGRRYHPLQDRMKVYADGSTITTTTNNTTVAGPSSSSSTSSLSAATVYSSVSAVGGRRPQPHRRSGSSGSDNFRAIDYALFAKNGAGRKSRGAGARQTHHRTAGRQPADTGRRPSAVGNDVSAMNRRSYSSEAVHLTGCRVYHHYQQHNQHQNLQHRQTETTAARRRRHSIHDGGYGGDVSSSSFFRADIENSLGYYP